VTRSESLISQAVVTASISFALGVKLQADGSSTGSPHAYPTKLSKVRGMSRGSSAGSSEWGMILGIVALFGLLGLGVYFDIHLAIGNYLASPTRLG
jgi:hypothetical protein